MNNLFNVSYAIGGFIATTLAHFFLWQVGRLFPEVLEWLQVGILVIASTSLVIILFSENRENNLSWWFVAVFLIGLTGILAWN